LKEAQMLGCAEDWQSEKLKGNIKDGRQGIDTTKRISI